MLRSWKVYSSAPAYSSIQPRHNQLVWSADGLDGIHMGPIRGGTGNEVVYPSELPVGLSTLLSHGPHSLSATHWRPSVNSPCTCSPHGPTWAPSRRSSVQRGKSWYPSGSPWGSHAPVVEAPIHFWPPFAARFRASPWACAGPNAAVVGDEGVGLPGKLGRAQHAVILLLGPRQAARGSLSSPYLFSLNMLGLSHIVMLCI